MTTPTNTQWFNRAGEPVTAEHAVELLTTPGYPQVATSRICFGRYGERSEVLAVISTTWLGRSSKSDGAASIFLTHLDDIDQEIQSDTLADARAVHESTMVHLTNSVRGRVHIVIQDYVGGKWVSR